MMRILVLGDFRARGEASGRLDERSPTAIDADSLERVLARMSPQLEPPGAAAGDPMLELVSMDDFHPDSIHREVPLFRRILELPPAGSEEPDTQTLARLLGVKAPPAAPPGGPAQSVVQALMREAVAPHIVPAASADQARHRAALDAATGEAMRAVLQNSRFKSLEALWRGVHWLASNLETDGELQLHILDATESELRADLEAAQGNPESSALHRLLVEGDPAVPGGELWSVLVGNYAFGPGAGDAALLAHLGATASRAGGPFLAAAKPDLLDAPAAEQWNGLRKSSLAPWIGLAFPRLLLRLPYGKSSDPVQSFPFEELWPSPAHESYLWGNGAFACALLLGRAFTARGRDMEPGDELEIDDLPAHVLDADGEKRLQPCAERLLTERGLQAILDAGIMPLMSYKDRNAVRLARFQSIANPARRLSGPWG